jgi:uncharacterized SAM-binding protein YcdF (DUF218 family)
MFHILANTVGFLSVPSNVLIFLGLVGALLQGTRFAGCGRRLFVVCILLIVGIGALPIGSLVIYPLEQRFPQWTATQGAPDGVIILGGVISPAISARRGTAALDRAAERITAAVELARRYPKVRIVFSGGNGNLMANRLKEADFAIRLLENLGVPKDRIVAERQARNTTENARFTKRLVAPAPGQRWLLVTSAMHMPRAVGAFREAGFPVEAYPVDYQTAGRPRLWALPGSLLGGITRTDIGVHEWLGLLAYWLTGRIPVLFPGPAPSQERRNPV